MVAIVYIDGGKGQRCNPETSLHIPAAMNIAHACFGMGSVAIQSLLPPLTLAQATPPQRFGFRLRFADINLSFFA